ncbi:MAG: ABC transporter substrate-binding protein [Clostridiales bacterium]|uniref:ABC transporter substrate-binding protein n=1 Tax=Terrisporobacter sp. TaxID=1965305 RepID=UPI002A504415|nr:ABC transporter substrate-binding protein [Terrisporobacter sp.]MDD7755825.1 ABC transporter substrate-binding protein [Clostridiales bacterium]MDY4135985.1 ABC transporter substrate-binding protein [Terrisporobacter sp.]
MKKISTLILTIILVVNLTGCSLSKDVRVKTYNGLPAISICKLIKEEENIKSSYKTSYTIESNDKKLVESLNKKQVDIALVPTDMVAKVYNKNSSYQICASIGQGSYYLVTSDPEVTGFNSTLINKEIAIAGESSMTDNIVKAILKKNNIDETLVKFKYTNTVPELVKTLTLGEIYIGIVPETSLTSLLYKHSGLKILASTNDAYENTFDISEGYPQFSVIVRKDFAKNNKEYVNKFLSKVKESIEFANNNPLQAGAYGEELKIPIKPQILSKAIKRCNLKFIEIDKFKQNYEYFFDILYNYNNEAVGGTVPDESIYH